MCGIAGIAGLQQNGTDREELRRMCNPIIHRGPDDEGFLVDGKVGLGVRRLSIIDVAGGHQPIHNEDRTIWAVYNGEIYNFRELRSHLEARGHRFYTGTDSEVIVHLYEDHGSDCVTHLRGMFALAVYDRRRQSVLLARDRLGIKPLHYAVHQGRVLFGSEIKSLLAVEPELAQVDREGLLHYLYFGYVPEPLCVFTRIRKLPAGHLVEVAGGRIEERRYWELPAFGTNDPGSEDELLEELEEHLYEAVRMRLVSEVPLGALLSGGVDSSVVVALMARAASAPVKTFSIGFPNKDFDESAYARAVAERFGTNHHQLTVEPAIWDTLNRLTESLEEPFADDSAVPTYHVSRLARNHVTVALSGDGGDEIFAGYDRYHRHLERSILDFVPERLGRWYRERVFPRLPIEWPGRRLLYNRTLSPENRYLDSVASLVVEARDRSVFSEEFLEWMDGVPSPFRAFRSHLDEARATDPLSRLQYLDVKTYLPGDILAKVDRMSMLVSLEVRVPLLDHVVVEWVTALAPRWKLRMSESKYILKRLAQKLGVPRHVIHRPKSGFAMPVLHWCRDQLREDVLEILLEPRTLQRGYFSPGALRRLLDDHLSARRDRSEQIWNLVCLELWHRNFLDRAPDRRKSPAATEVAT